MNSFRLDGPITYATTLNFIIAFTNTFVHIIIFISLSFIVCIAWAQRPTQSMLGASTIKLNLKSPPPAAVSRLRKALTPTSSAFSLNTSSSCVS